MTYSMGKTSIEVLRKEYGVKDADPNAPEKGGIELHTYDAVHTVTDEELEDLRKWVKRIVPSQLVQG